MFEIVLASRPQQTSSLCDSPLDTEDEAVDLGTGCRCFDAPNTDWNAIYTLFIVWSVFDTRSVTVQESVDTHSVGVWVGLR